MPNDEYILRSDAISLIVNGNELIGRGWLIKELATLPAADVESVRHAEWVFDPLAGDWICSDCDLHSMEHGRFCPNCGAKMNEESTNA